MREEIDRLLDNRLFPYVVAPIMLWAFFFVQWLQAYTKSALQPRLILCLAIVATGVSIIGIRRLFPQVRNLVRGERGERHVAELLEEIRAKGYHCCSDIVGDGFNIDHVVVGPTGIFAIETKYRSGFGEIEYRNSTGLFIGGKKQEDALLNQARASAAHVRRMLKEDTGRSQWVKAVLVFVGDWKIKNAWRDTDVAVLSENELPTYFDRYDPELTRNEIDLIASHLARSVKA